jgi:hypothetical protein
VAPEPLKPKPPKPPAPGDPFVYQPSHDIGLGANANGQALHPEMHVLDLQPGTPVILLDFDADSEWPIIQWTDADGALRNATINPDEFNDDFTPTGK